MILKAIRVYIGQTDDYRIHHIIEVWYCMLQTPLHCTVYIRVMKRDKPSFCTCFLQKVDKKGPAWEAGLRKGCLVTHINGQSVIGLHHIQVMKLMIDKHNSFLYINTIPLEDTSIRKDKKKRLPTLGHRVGKLFRHRSSGSGRIKKKSFISRMRGRDRKGVDSSGHSSSSTPSPKHSSSPFQDRVIQAEACVQDDSVKTTHPGVPSASQPSRRSSPQTPPFPAPCRT